MPNSRWRGADCGQVQGNPGAIYPVLGFLSGESGSRLPDIANALCSCLSLNPRTSWPEPPAISVARVSAENR